MKARWILAIAGGALIAGLAAAPPAEASHGWSFGAGFQVGGAHFRVGFGPAVVGQYGGPFFFTGQRLHYRGHRCHGACFRRGAGFYHHPACSVVGFHFHRGGYSAGHYLHHYAPYRGGRYFAPRPYGSGYYLPYGPRYYRDHHRRHYRRGHRGWQAPRYRQHPYWQRYRDWDADSDSDSDRDRWRRRGRRYR